MEFIAGNLFELQSRVSEFEQHVHQNKLSQQLVNGFADVPEWDVLKRLQLDEASSTKFTQLRLNESMRDFLRLRRSDLRDLFSVYGALTLYQFKDPGTALTLAVVEPFTFSVAVLGMPKVT